MYIFHWYVYLCTYILYVYVYLNEQVCQFTIAYGSYQERKIVRVAVFAAKLNSLSLRTTNQRVEFAFAFAGYILQFACYFAVSTTSTQNGVERPQTSILFRMQIHFQQLYCLVQNNNNGRQRNRGGNQTISWRIFSLLWCYI